MVPVTEALNIKISAPEGSNPFAFAGWRLIFPSMKRVIPTTFLALSLCFATQSVAAQSADAPSDISTIDLWQEDPLAIFEASESTLQDFLWRVRPLIVFADSPNDPQFRLQMDLIEERFSALAPRDIIVLVDTDPAMPSELRRTLRPRGFMLVAVDKDGTVLFRKPAPWDVREISRSIDKSPIRLQEIEDSHLPVTTR